MCSLFPEKKRDKDEDEDNNTKFENEREYITTETTIELELLKSSVSQSLYKDVLSIIEKEKNSQVKSSSLYIMLNISKEIFPHSDIYVCYDKCSYKGDKFFMFKHLCKNFYRHKQGKESKQK